MLSFLLLIFLLPQINHHSSQLPDYSPATSHELWDNLLKKYVSASGIVDYKGMKADEPKLKAYLAQLKENPPSPSWTKAETMAYWINAYNAFTVDLILQHYPVKSILDIDNGKPWDDAFIKIGENRFTLNNIENDILRKQYSDARIHFAINCASKSCPKLLNEAYTAEKLDEQLNAQAKNFVNDPSRNEIGVGKVSVSKIFDWYKEDFSKGGGVIEFLNQFSNTSIQSTAAISYLGYDWTLNE